jgi:hypothetical protein
VWKNNFNHPAVIFDDHNDEQVEEDKEEKYYSLRIKVVIFSTYYSGRRYHLSHVVVLIMIVTKFYGSPLSCYELEVVMMVVDDIVSRLWS